nr:MAG TPA: protein of unknown function (DUF5053) [Caudoviricetes sp.]
MILLSPPNKRTFSLFSESERKQLSAALEDIGRMAHEPSLKVS